MRSHALRLSALVLSLPAVAACVLGAPGVSSPMADGGERRELLRVTKSENANYVVYDRILDSSGQLADAPLDVYWIMGAETGQREELSRFEQDIYGITIEQVDREEGRLVFAINAFKSRHFVAEIAPASGGGGLFTTIDGDRAQVTDVHLTVRQTWNPLRPDVEIRLAGEADRKTGLVPVEEIIRR